MPYTGPIPLVELSDEPATGVDVTGLEGVAKDLIRDSLAPSSRKAYRVGQSEFMQFCHCMGVSPLPARESILILFVAHLSLRLAHSSVRSYLSAIRHMHIVQGLGDPLAGALRLQLALRGLNRSKPKAKDTRLPITPYVLRRVKAALDREPHKWDNVMLWSACCLGFFAFLRSGEMTSPSVNSFDPAWHLTPMDIAVDDLQSPSLIQISLKGSKTDQARQGINLFIGRTNNELCPIAAMLAYLAARGFDQGPLFQTEDRQPLTRAKLVSLLRSTLTAAGIDPTGYSGHSFRIGAATTAAACGIHDSTIQTLGRWASDSYLRYIRMPQQTLAQLSASLGR